MFAEIIMNRILLSCIAAVITSQIIKMLLDYLDGNKLNPKLLFSAGGMPSSHSAVVSALAVSIYIDQGASALFAAALVFAVITVYDSVTLRRAVGNHTSILNLIIKSLKLHSRYSVREFSGHSLIQAFAGVAMGMVIACVVHLI